MHERKLLTFHHIGIPIGIEFFFNETLLTFVQISNISTIQKKNKKKNMQQIE